MCKIISKKSNLRWLILLVNLFFTFHLIGQKTEIIQGKFSNNNLFNDSSFLQLDSNGKKEMIANLKQLKKSNLSLYVKAITNVTTIDEKKSDRLFKLAEKIKKKIALLKTWKIE